MIAAMDVKIRGRHVRYRASKDGKRVIRIEDNVITVIKWEK
jgi:hypothetical protein